MSVYYTIDNSDDNSPDYFSWVDFPETKTAAATVAEAIASKIYYEQRSIDWWPLTIHLFSRIGSSYQLRWSVKVNFVLVPRFEAQEIEEV